MGSSKAISRTNTMNSHPRLYPLVFLLALSLTNPLFAQSFTPITSGNVVTDGGVSASCAWGDYDNDGHLDLFVANLGQNNFLYHNNGDGTFTKITTGNIVTDVGWSLGCAWGDYDNDGYLDLYVASSGGKLFYHNNGDGTFSKITTGIVATDNQG